MHLPYCILTVSLRSNILQLLLQLLLLLLLELSYGHIHMVLNLSDLPPDFFIFFKQHFNLFFGQLSSFIVYKNVLKVTFVLVAIVDLAMSPMSRDVIITGWGANHDVDGVIWLLCQSVKLLGDSFTAVSC